jgi:hypothetical protein
MAACWFLQDAGNPRGPRDLVLPPDVEINSGGTLQPVNAATIGLVLGMVLGISRSRVVNLAADGVLPRAGRGLFDLPACVQSYVNHKLSLAKAGDGTALSLVAERSRLTKIKADNASSRSGSWPVNWCRPLISKPPGLPWPVSCVLACY